MSEGVKRVRADALESFVARIFAAAGTPAGDAATIAEVLVWANLRGIDTHGVLRVPGYVGRIESGEFNPRPDIATIADLPAAAVIDADRAFGAVGMSRGIEIAIAKARTAGIGACIVRRVTHMAAIGWFALKAAEAGMAGLVFGSSRPNMAYHGARARGVATSPIAIAVPRGAGPPVLLDMATSTSSMGKVMLARDSGAPLEPGSALTEAGEPTVDAEAARFLTPLGGAKGSGLALMFECLTGVLVGNPLIATAIGPEGDRRHSQNGFALAIDIAAFAEPARYRGDIDALVAALKSLPPAPGHDEVRVPGERGEAAMAERLAAGVPLPAGTWRRLAEVASGLGVAMPPAIGGAHSPSSRSLR